MKSNEIRQNFLKFFEKNGHKVVQSDSLIPSGDPTLLFSSAGMVQFKKHFLGQAKDSYKRAASCQKCFRTSDIDRVGFTSRHLTFFEMLGNFSFGDYFKKDAIAWAWEFLTKDMALPKDKLYPTVYKDDDEAFDLWKKTAPESNVMRLGEETNFWNMGPTGPCGPCSEIYLDLGPEMGCGNKECAPGCDCDRYIEIWNLVFTQFDRQEDGSLKNLPYKNIDTGMGFERLVAAVNGKKSFFDTDLFKPLIGGISDILEIDEKKSRKELRMMADHSRAVTMLISDGVLPSNEGRGYVLRRILRRAVRQGKLFGASEPFLYKFTAETAEIMKGAYPELEQRRENIAGITKMEEEKFLETLEAGSKILDDLIKKCKAGTGKTKIIPGGEVFKLYDTYGFPQDLTKEIAKEHGLGIDEEGFMASQKEAQEKSRAAWSGSGEKDITFYSKLHKETGDILFTGYESLASSATVKALIKGNEKVNALNAGEEGKVILNETPFYAESGGQVGDTGQLEAGSGKVEVNNVYKPVDGLFVHQIKVLSGKISAGDKVEAKVDAQRRHDIMRHHTATHLLHRALRQVLGTHVTQAGSLVTPDNLRFDFTHLAAMKPEDIEAVEQIVNKAARDNMQVCIALMKLDEARKHGAMALFGEKYGEKVRAVSVMKKEGDEKFSMELCGGTHVSFTGDIGFFKIVSESSIASGVRRIEAVAGGAAEKHVRSKERILQDLAAKMKVSQQEMPQRLEKLLQQEKVLEKEISKLKSQLASGGMDDMLKNIRDVDGIKLLVSKTPDADVKSLRSLVDGLTQKLGNNSIIIIAGAAEDKISFIVSVAEDLVKTGYNAGKIAKSLSAMIGGSGGGKPDFAQGGGKDPSKLDEALNKIAGMLK
ncbi:MAG: alanine--tRNA ligase [Elusimicrobiota bacterium]